MDALIKCPVDILAGHLWLLTVSYAWRYASVRGECGLLNSYRRSPLVGCQAFFQRYDRFAYWLSPFLAPECGHLRPPECGWLPSALV